MADRDWDKELAKIDKQLNSLPDDKAVVPSTAGKPAAQSSGKVAKSEPMGEPKLTTSLGVYARLTISVLLGCAMVFWPYPARCGPGLAAYLAAVVVVIGSGVWSSVWTWRHRASRAHTLSLLLILWGLLLGATEVLPRVGYAKPDLRHGTTWMCPK
ncbi:MAG TPA: hypothetical protein VGM44_05555 [Polyangiaceae bacterium]